MISRIIILGGHIQALGLVRQAKAKSLSTILIVQDRCSVARFSRYTDRMIVCKDELELEQKLARFQGKDVLLFPTSDDYIDFILRHYDSLKSSFVVALPGKETTELFADKRKTYQFAERYSIPHPRSWYPESMHDVSRMAEKIEYPVVIKPAVMYSFHKRFGKKAFLCKDKAVFMNKMVSLSRSCPLESLIVQEFLPGGPKCLYSYGVFAVDGNPVVNIVVNRIRQNPMMFGNSTTFATTCCIPEIEDEAKRILELTRYTGLAEIEFMYHNGEYKFLEVNTRAWKWHTISHGRGFGFLSEWIDYLRGAASEKERDLNPVFWEERLTDVYVVSKEVLKGRMRLKEYFETRKGKKVRAVWSSKDPLPAIMYVLLSPVLYFKRH